MASSLSWTTRFPPLPLSLLAFAVATVTAFAVTIYGDFAEVPPLWTSCSSYIPTPVCFAVHFFQEAHGTLHGRLEQAVIVSFLSALSNITAIESVRARRRAAMNSTTTTTKDMKPGSAHRKKEDQGLSLKIVNNLTIPWLLYGLVMGALAWQLIIVPAFLHLHHKYPGPQLQQQRQETRNNINHHQANNPDAYPLSIPLSIALGLLLPVISMLLYPTAIIPVLLFLFFPILITLAHKLLSTFVLHTTTNSSVVFHAIPILASAFSHAAILFLPIENTPASSAGAAALRFLRLDHIVIYVTVLYWIASTTTKTSSSTTSITNVLTTIATTAVLGPGAGICIGWIMHSSKALSKS